MEDTSQNNSNSSGVPSPKVNGELYALGAMSPQERQEFEARLAAGEVDPEEISEYLLVVTEIAEELASVMPAPRRAVKDALMAAIAPDHGHSDHKHSDHEHSTENSSEHLSENSSAAKEQLFVFAHEGEWQEMIPGITIKILFHDAEHSRTTLLVRLEPGAAYPSHRHNGIEECLVLEGDLHVDGTVLHKGDFTVSLDEKIHLDTHSEEGCVLLISSPMNDEILGHP